MKEFPEETFVKIPQRRTRSRPAKLREVYSRDGLNRCPTLKRRFPTHESALKRAAEILSTEKTTVKDFGAYKCPLCGFYHLTSRK